MTIGVMFPGQGTQRVGMGRWLERASPAAAAVFDRAGTVLGRDVRRLCFGGPARELTDTRNAQVAVFTVNAAALALLRDRGHDPQVALGHSVGELNALVAADALDLDDGLRLVAARGELMGRITTPGAMSSVLGLDPDRVRELCAQAQADTGQPVVAALLNGPDTVVVSGAATAVTQVEELARAAGAGKATRLTVSSAFHSPLMAEAVPAWREVVAGTPLRSPDLPVYLGTTGARATGTADVRAALVDQLTGPVRWVEVLRAAVAAAPGVRFVEAGDSKVLVALARSIAPGLSTVTAHDPRALRSLDSAPAPPAPHGRAEPPLARTRTVVVPERGRPRDLLEGLAPAEVFTERERAECTRRPGLTGYAGRLAAKLAVGEVLGLPVGGPLAGAAGTLARIEIVPDPDGPCGGDPDCPGPHGPVVLLHGSLLEKPARVRVSITHSRALAVALAVREPTDERVDRS